MVTVVSWNSHGSSSRAVKQQVAGQRDRGGVMVVMAVMVVLVVAASGWTGAGSSTD